MPRFTPDPTKASFGFTIFPKGTYRVQLEIPKSFFNAGKNGKGVNYGVRINGKVVESDDHPELIGKNFPITMYQHSEGAANYSKQIQAAALGCEKDEEFNENYGDEDWSFNTDDQSAGGGWHLMKGQVMDIDVGDPNVDENTGNQQTNVLKYRKPA